jgi:adenine-specific DNA-methyltransferase
MEKIIAGEPQARSADIIADNLKRLNALFPEAFTEGKVDFAVLRQLLGDNVDESDEKYGLNWYGKRRARQLALTPSLGTLRPCPEESVDWDMTQNLMIEGDNLEVLKLLQKSYSGKVKLIYIDPPYNTGKDFVYSDNYRDNLQNYLESTGQTDSSNSGTFSSNSEASGRFHTYWLNMILPRLYLARSLLRKDGTIMISIDDTEVAHVRLIMDDIFGPENFIAEIVWEGANKNDARQIGICHEYVIVYAKNRESLQRDWGLDKEGVQPVLQEVNRLRGLHGTDYCAASEDLAGWFRANKAKPAFANRRFRNIDARGAYKEDDPTAPGGRKFELRNPRTGQVIPLRQNRGWSFDQERFDRLVGDGRITFVTETSVMVRRYLHETDKLTPPSVFYQPARSASERLNRMMGAQIFDYPKDESILGKFIQMATDDDPNAIVMDFFAGSGTTGHAALERNSLDNGNRRYVLVQLPEPLDSKKSHQRAATDYCDELRRPRSIAELTKERLRRAAQKIKDQNPEYTGDLGFRVFKLDTSNIRAWNSKPDNLEGALRAALNHVESGRTEEDILYELLLKLGLDLCVPIETRTIAARAVHAVGAGTLIACLDEAISSDEVEPLGVGIADWHDMLDPAGESTVVFRDSAFGDDVAKTNLTAILEQRGLGNVRSL